LNINETLIQISLKYCGYYQRFETLIVPLNKLIRRPSLKPAVYYVPSGQAEYPVEVTSSLKEGPMPDNIK